MSTRVPAHSSTPKRGRPLLYLGEASAKVGWSDTPAMSAWHRWTVGRIRYIDDPPSPSYCVDFRTQVKSEQRQIRVKPANSEEVTPQRAADGVLAPFRKIL